MSEVLNVAALKQKIIEAGISGKLVPQIASEGTAEELLKQIEAERTSLIKAGKIKKEKPLPEITEDEIPFEIPKSWEWVRLGELFQHNNGKQLNASDKTGTLLTYITTSNLYWNSFILDNLNKMYFEDGELEKCTAIKGDLLVCEGGDIGRAAIWNFDEPIRLQNHIHKLRRIYEIEVRFYYFVLYLYKITGKINGNGIGILSLSSSRLHNMVIPLPPLSEQKRIVAKIEEVMIEIDNIERLQSSYTANQGALKKKIIEAGITGKLVPQIASDGTAEELLKQIEAERAALIKAGKIKKEKPLPEITKDEIPFEIPKSWKWVRFGNLCHIIHYGYTASASNEGNAKLLRITDIQDNKVDWKKLPYCTISSNDLEKYNLNNGDILFARTGGTVGKTYLVNSLNTETPVVFASYLIRAIPMQSICDVYIKKFMESPLYWSQVFNKAKGTGQDNVNGEELKQMLIPIPPLSEQKRIVAMIEELLQIIDNKGIN